MFALTGIGMLRADEPQVEASLSSSEVQLGDGVNLEIKITGAGNVNPPDNISINGLTIGGLLQSTQNSISIINGNYSSTKTTTFTFPITPRKPGTFIIPSLTVVADGKKLSTRPIKLIVTGNGAPSGGGGTNTAPQSGTAGSDEEKPETDSRIAQAELILPKSAAYLGEAVPLEIRLYFDAQVQVQVQPGVAPQIELDGFTMQKLTKPQQKQVEKDGKTYNCLIYKTVITPAKTGKLQIGPLEMPYIAVVPVRRKTQRPRLGNAFDAIFNDPFFNNMAETRRLEARSEGVEIEIKPLPAAGRPGSFNGAVGVFSLDTHASPLKVNIGDPITVKSEISGHGNFDRVNAPVMSEESGWRSYSPTSKFMPDDDAGISGIKVFEMAVIPQEKKAELPPMEFSYFDPGRDKYVTLSSKPVAITVEGQNPQVVAQTTPAQQTSASPAPSPQSKQKTDDIFYISDAARWGESFAPVYARREFWLAQLIPALALMAFVGIQIRNTRRNNTGAIRLANLQREKNELLKIMNHAGTGYTPFFEAALKYIQVETARVTGRDPASISSGDAIASRPLDPAVAMDVGWIFNACAEQRYTGGSSNTGSVPEGKRAKVLETIRKYEQS